MAPNLILHRSASASEMSRRSRAGTAEKPPSVEETLGRLEVKLKELELKYELREKEEAAYRAGMQDSVDTLRIAVQTVGLL